MRHALIVATHCLVAVSQPGFSRAIGAHGSNDIRLSRPDTSYGAFMDDRNACLSTASHRNFASTGAPSVALVAVHYDLYEFAACMTAKGYRLDPKGYRAAAYIRMGDGKILFTPDPL